MKRRMQRGMFAAAMAAALGFGGAQAFASPGAAQAARACDPGPCDENCRARGFSGGYCQFGWCGCYVDMPPAS